MKTPVEYIKTETNQTSAGTAEQVYWRTGGGKVLVTSAVNNPFGSETMVFVGDLDVGITDFKDLGTSEYGDHEGALNDAGYTTKTPRRYRLGDAVVVPTNDPDDPTQGDILIENHGDGWIGVSGVDQLGFEFGLQIHRDELDEFIEGLREVAYGE